MASGGFHGGGFHSGGHHSSGGFGGGGHFGGGSHYSGGHYGGYYRGSSSGGGGDGISLLFYLLVGAAFIIIYFLIGVAEGVVPGLNLVNLGIFISSAVLFYLGLRDFDRTADLKEVRRSKESDPQVNGKVWNGDTLAYKKGDKRSWVGKYNYEYRISFFDPEYGAENVRKVKETMKRTPKILWMNPFVWLYLGIVFTICNFFFYELVIPYFENMIMTDIAFKFIDELVFYLPSILTVLCSIATIIITKAKDRILYKCAERIVNDNTSAEEREKTERFITSELSKKWYHNFCPNCGAPASHALRFCSSCGSSLEVKSFNTGAPGAVHRVSSSAEKENKE